MGKNPRFSWGNLVFHAIKRVLYLKKYWFLFLTVISKASLSIWVGLEVAGARGGPIWCRVFSRCAEGSPVRCIGYSADTCSSGLHNQICTSRSWHMDSCFNTASFDQGHENPRWKNDLGREIRSPLCSSRACSLDEWASKHLLLYDFFDRNILYSSLSLRWVSVKQAGPICVKSK